MPKVNGSNPARSIRVAVVDDHRFMREVIVRMLARHRDQFDVIGEAHDAGTAVKLCAECKPDLLILDINLPGISGIEAVREIRRVSPRTRVLLCTATASDKRVADALHSGADAFVEKTNTWEEFADVVERVSRGERYFRASSNPMPPPKPSGRGTNGSHPQIALTRREHDVLTLIAQGNTTKAAATQLGVSVGTVETHRTNLMRKLKARNVAGLIGHALRKGLIALDWRSTERR